MKLKFKNQAFQMDAVNAVVDLFAGQEKTRSTFSVMEEAQTNFLNELGQGNALYIDQETLTANMHTVQKRNNLPLTPTAEGCQFCIEMETGTGKTYVYTKTIFELNRKYGFTKFVIVVPSVAIREGVYKSFQVTQEHFGLQYDNVPCRYFIYNSAKLSDVRQFATSSNIEVMIINIDAFKKAENIINQAQDRLNGETAMGFIQNTHPIVIIDEPQSVDNTPKAKEAIATLNPLCVLRYSATHREKINLLYRLTPVDAYQMGLVKQIAVSSNQVAGGFNQAYVRLLSVSNDKGFKARVELDVKGKTGAVTRKAMTVKPGDDLFLLSGGRELYEGYTVTGIDCTPDFEHIEFGNTQEVKLGKAIGDVDENIVKKAQIRRTIETHLDKELRYLDKGIKVLSLFFIDKVDKYRHEDGTPGIYATMFEECYQELIAKPKYALLRERFTTDVSKVHNGYFSQDKKGRLKDTKGDTQADDDTYNTIMRDKEWLLSFECPLRFIFSHSALREGWDNPNVFQICTLVETKDNLTKRQKIGRGLRLCVNQDGERLYDPEANVLTVIANESYDDFANGLQKELEAEDFKFGVITPESFTKVTVKGDDGVEERLGYEKSKQVYDHLVATGMVDDKGAVTPELKAAAEEGKVELPAELEPAKEQVEAIIIHKSQRVQIRDKAKEVSVELQKDVTLDPAFQALWDRIRQRTRFQVEVDSGKLIEHAIEAVDGMLAVRPPQVTSERASLGIDDAGVSAEGTGTSVVSVSGKVKYDLPDPIAELQDAVGLTRGTIKAILEGCSRLDEFEIDPATFLAQVGDKINRVKNDLIAQGIKYVRLPEDEWYTMRDLELDDYTAYLGQNAWKPDMTSKSLYNYVVYDSAGVERSFAEALDKQEEVLVFAKLPSAFKIDTPLGSYNPDWAYVEEADGERRVYFVTETKGGKNGEPALRDAEKIKIGCAKKHFEALDLGNDFHYNVRTTYQYEAVKA